MPDDTVRVRYTNLPEFVGQLKTLQSDMKEKIVKPAVASAANTFAAGARLDNAFITRSGTLRRAIYGIASKYKQATDTVYGIVSVRSGSNKSKKVVARLRRAGQDAYYWRFVEAGHIKRQPGGAVRGGKRTKALVRARLKKSGDFVEGRFFLRKSFTAYFDKAVENFNRVVRNGIEQFNRTGQVGKLK